MHCLWNYIGLKGCGNYPTSGRYVNELPGISNDIVQSFTNRETVTAVEQFKKVQLLAWDKLISDIPQFIEQKYKLMSLQPLANDRIVPLDEYFGNTPGFYGWQITIDPSQSKFLGIHLSGVKIWTSGPGTYRVLVISRANVILIDENVTITSGNFYELTFDIILETDPVFVGVELTNDSIAEGVIADEWIERYNCETCCIDCDGVTMKRAYRLSENDPIEGLGNTPGIEPLFSRVCDYSAIICRNKRTFFRVWQYLLGWQILSYLKANGNMDRYTTVLAPDVEDLISQFAGEYEKSLESILKNMVLDPADICVECNTSYQRQWYMP